MDPNGHWSVPNYQTTPNSLGYLVDREQLNSKIMCVDASLQRSNLLAEEIPSDASAGLPLFNHGCVKALAFSGPILTAHSTHLFSRNAIQQPLTQCGLNTSFLKPWLPTLRLQKQVLIREHTNAGCEKARQTDNMPLDFSWSTMFHLSSKQRISGDVYFQPNHRLPFRLKDQLEIQAGAGAWQRQITIAQLRQTGPGAGAKLVAGKHNCLGKWVEFHWKAIHTTS